MNLQLLYIRDFKQKRLELFNKYSHCTDIARNELLTFLTIKARRGNTTNCIKTANFYISHLREQRII
ncbi:MAG: hypothetical protein HON90_07680 [Halobacteriovoraceae bacterium]|jgi:hypothetical protein|nr:hypothetical protein [Halobacteriovoraceae bacterium]